MTRYTSYGLDLSENQLEKIINAAKADKGTTIKLTNNIFTVILHIQWLK